MLNIRPEAFNCTCTYYKSAMTRVVNTWDLTLGFISKYAYK